MKHILIFFSFFFISTLHAQTFFEKFIGANGILQAGNIKKTADSGFIITGSYRIRERVSPQYIVLVKLDNRAKVQRTRVFGDGVRSFDPGIVTTCTDGGYAVTGVVFEGDVHYIFVVKFNNTGDIAWSKKITYTLQESSSLYANDITEAQNGTLLITGETNESNLGDEFVLSIKSSNGNVNWFKTIGTNDYKQTSHSIHITDDGGFVVGGTTIPDEGNYFIVKYNSQGTPEWTRTIKSRIISNSVLYSIIPTLDNGYAFTGITSADNNNYNVIAVKLNSAHNVEWSKKMQRSTYDVGNAIIQVREDSSYFIAGAQDAVGISATKAYLIHLNKNGKLLSSTVTPGAGKPAYFTSVIKNRSSIVSAGTSNNKIFVTKYDDSGMSCNAIDANDTSLKNYPVDPLNVTYVAGDITSQATITNLPLNELKIDSRVKVICTSNNTSIAKSAAIDNIASPIHHSFSLKIYPNPVIENMLNMVIACHQLSDVSVAIVNIQGKIILLQSMFSLSGSFTKAIDVSSLAKGVYLLKVSAGKEQSTVKFIKEL